MRVHHLNCISTCPLGGKLMDGETASLLKRGHLTCHCLLLECDDGLVLVDTGLGMQDVANPRKRLSWFFLALVSPDFRKELTAVHQVEALGFSRNDVKHILLTHLDFDHAGGLDDFPNARIHMLRQERDYALQQKTWLDRQRFRPQQWSSQQHWQVYDSSRGGDSWLGFEAVRPLSGIEENICLIPLPGHTHGHCGVAINSGEKQLLLAGDAYFYHREMKFDDPYCTPGLRFYQTMMDKDRKARLANQDRLRQFVKQHGSSVEVFCSHDCVEFRKLSGREPEQSVRGVTLH